MFRTLLIAGALVASAAVSPASSAPPAPAGLLLHQDGAAPGTKAEHEPVCTMTKDAIDCDGHHWPMNPATGCYQVGAMDLCVTVKDK